MKHHFRLQQSQKYTLFCFICLTFVIFENAVREGGGAVSELQRHELATQIDMHGDDGDSEMFLYNKCVQVMRTE